MSNRPGRCNNPINAKWDGQANAKPFTIEINGVQEVFAQFDTFEQGTAYAMDCLSEVITGTSAVYNTAAHNLDLANSGDLTLNQFFIRDGASDGNNPSQYAAAAGKSFGVNPAIFQMSQFTV